MEDNESPWRTLYVAGIAPADPRLPLLPVVRVVCRADVAAAADVADGADAVASWLAESSTAVCAVAASAAGGACGDKQRAAATVARVGAAAAVAPCGSWIRDGLRWRPKGLPSAKFALTGKMHGSRARSRVPSKRRSPAGYGASPATSAEQAKMGQMSDRSVTVRGRADTEQQLFMRKLRNGAGNDPFCGRRLHEPLCRSRGSGRPGPGYLEQVDDAECAVGTKCGLPVRVGHPVRPWVGVEQSYQGLGDNPGTDRAETRLAA